MRRPALIALAVLTVAPASACRDFISSDDSTPFFEGSFDAQEIVPSGAGNDLIAQGWNVGIAFVQGLYFVVRLPPEQQFAEPQISFGRFTPDNEQGISFSDEDDEPLEMGAYTVEGTQGNETVQFDFEQGSLGFLQMRTTPIGFGNLTTIGGTYEATEFALTGEDGTTIDVLEDPDSEVLINITSLGDDWPTWGSYQLSIDLPAGALADDSVSVSYPADLAGNPENFIGVGQSMVFFGLLGCETFAGGDVQLSGAIAFRGYACDLGGESYMLRARFEGN